MCALAASGLTAIPLQWEVGFLISVMAKAAQWGINFRHSPSGLYEIACTLIIPWALIFGMVRDIPFFWTLIDISFGVFGIIPLWLARSDTLRLRGAN
jgi:hypothetical protein